MTDLAAPIHRVQQVLLHHQSPDGTWWFTLEANESIGAGLIALLHFLDVVDRSTEQGLVGRILREQRPDGSWGLFHGAPGDLSITIECYLALRLAGHDPNSPPLQKARTLILAQGGLTACRIFTRIHLALFGLVPWSSTPAMPPWVIFMPVWSGASIYEFSSWARASIVPLLIILNQKPIHPLPFTLDELYVGCRDFLPTVVTPKSILGRFFVQLDKFFKKLEKISNALTPRLALKRCETWTREHVARTADIYPAMAYAALAMKALGHQNEDETIQQALRGLQGFRQEYQEELPAFVQTEQLDLYRQSALHQQCCISPLWDTPWTGLALLESGISADDPRLQKAARTLIGKQITEFKGDWSQKNRRGVPGGWAFEFKNDYFPDVDDTIQAALFLKQVKLPWQEKDRSLTLALNWLLSMQSSNGGWAAFDRNNTASWVNQIPFSDHGACLDPPTPDVTGRMLELLVHFGYTEHHPIVQKTLHFLWQHQERDGSWRGRWGVNFIYGTWCVLQGLAAQGIHNEATERAAEWLLSIQNKEGGWGESCSSDRENQYVALARSVPSQTAWALMGLLAAGLGKLEPAQRGLHWLVKQQSPTGEWPELEFTGTGFPGHFYIRYHGYRYYFPLLALGKYRHL